HRASTASAVYVDTRSDEPARRAKPWRPQPLAERTELDAKIDELRHRIDRVQPPDDTSYDNVHRQVERRLAKAKSNGLPETDSKVQSLRAKLRLLEQKIETAKQTQMASEVSTLQTRLNDLETMRDELESN